MNIEINENIRLEEKQHAIREQEMINYMDSFFSEFTWFERTSGTHNCTEELFKHAFKRGWHGKDNQLDLRGIDQGTS